MGDRPSREANPVISDSQVITAHSRDKAYRLSHTRPHSAALTSAADTAVRRPESRPLG